MSHKEDKERAENGHIFRNGELVQKPKKLPTLQVIPKETPENLPPTEYEDYYNPGSYCVLPKHRMEHCQERYCHGCSKHLDYKRSLAKPNPNK